MGVVEVQCCRQLTCVELEEKKTHREE